MIALTSLALSELCGWGSGSSGAVTGEDLALIQCLSIYPASQPGFVVYTELCVSAETVLAVVDLLWSRRKGGLWESWATS